MFACKNFDFLKTNKSGCTLDAIYFANMATGQKQIFSDRRTQFKCFLQDCTTSIA
jgi:hypothetical protein